MKICSIHIRGFNQFQDVCLDFTDPASGNPLDKICLIGPNGTGKSTILRMLQFLLRNLGSSGNPSEVAGHPRELAGHPILICRFDQDGEPYVLCSSPLQHLGTCYSGAFLRHDLFRQLTEGDQRVYPPELTTDGWIEDASALALKDGDSDLVTLAYPDFSSLLPEDPPAPTLDEALNLFKSFSWLHAIHNQRANAFWQLLIYLVKKRENDYREFENKPENLKKTVERVRREFDEENEEILPAIANLWNGILARAGLELDLKGITVPVQLNDTLSVTVRTKQHHKPLLYNQLSTGMRNFLLRIGYIKALYFNRKISRGFALIDEPENSLFPDLLFDLVETYVGILENTQLFMATQSPIVAAQFRPEERCVLEFDDDACTTCRRGVAPAGDDPNDLLRKDFSVRSIYGKAAIEKWERYRELKRGVSQQIDPDVKNQMLDELSKIRREYDFDPNHALPS